MRSDYFALAFSNLRKRGIRSLLTILGIFIGIAAVVSLISLGEGLRTAITAQFATLSVDRLTIQNAGTGFGPPGSTSIKKLTNHDIRIIESVPGIDLTLSRLIRVTRVEFNDATVFNYIANLPNNQEQLDFIYDSFSIQAESGRLAKAGEHGKVILGSDFADPDLNGFGKAIRVGNSITIQGKKFEVVGILKKASSFTINSVVQMNEDDMREILNIPDDEYDVIVVKVTDKDRIEEVAQTLTAKLRRDRNEKVGEEDFSVETPLQSLGTVNTILSVVNLVVAGIAAISLLIGAIGIANTMYTSVLERTKEIGVMKAIGAQNKDVLSIFLIEAGLLGLVGGIAGALLGLALAFAVASAANAALHTTILTVEISYPLIFSAIAFSFVLGIGSGILPAIQGSRLKPVEALRT